MTTTVQLGIEEPMLFQCDLEHARQMGRAAHSRLPRSWERWVTRIGLRRCNLCGKDRKVHVSDEERLKLIRGPRQRLRVIRWKDRFFEADTMREILGEPDWLLPRSRFQDATHAQATCQWDVQEHQP